MTLPEDYVFTGTLNQNLARIGLMVAPLCLKYLADNITRTYSNHTRDDMKKIVVEKDLGEKETFDKWNGKFLDKTSYDTLVKVTDEDVGVMKPVNSLDGSDVPLAYVITNVYNDNDVIRNTLMSIEDVSVMRANCSGPILEEDMLKKGLKLNVDYRLRTPNSYQLKTKSGKWGMIAYSNEIHSVMIGYKRGRFTGGIDSSGWVKRKSREVGKVTRHCSME